MTGIPVSFEYKGRQYCGSLDLVSGAASKMWHLMIDRYYKGQMSYSQGTGFRFTSQTGEFEELTDFFAEVVIAWYE